jgi:hypothetical protein
MSREFLKTFSPENQRSFEALTIPRLQRMVPDQDCAPQALLQASGVSSLSEFVRRRHGADPIDLGSIDDDGRPDPLRMRLQGLVKDFFLGESVYLERHSGQEHRSRRPPQHLDVRLIGSCKLSSTGEGIRLFCCRYGETVDGLKESSDSAWRYRDVQLHPRDVHLAIPSRAGLKPPDAVSLVSPLRMHPREYVEEGEAGAIFACTEKTPGYAADIYWSEEAFVESLNRLQDIGRQLIERAAIVRAIGRGAGECEFPGASAMLSKLYEGAAHYAQSQDNPLLLSGIWGIAVHKESPKSFLCQIGVVGFEFDFSKQDADRSILPSKERCFAIINFIMTRDEFGFLLLQPTCFTRRSIGALPWYDELPVLT